MKKELLHLEKNFISKNNYPRWVIKQILTQVEKQQERNSMNKNNNDDSNTNNENSFTNENNSQMSEKQLSFITLPYKGQQGEKVLKSFKATLHRSLPNNIKTKVVYTGTKLVTISYIFIIYRLELLISSSNTRLKLLVILLVIKLYARINVFVYISNILSVRTKSLL